MTNLQQDAPTKRDQFLLHLYDNLWQSIDRVESGVWQFVAIWALIVGLIIGVGQAGVPASQASLLSLIISFWGINVALNAAKWFNRNRLFVVNIEKQFLLSTDLGRILPASYHSRTPRLWNFLNAVHAMAFAAAGGLTTWLYFPQAPREALFTLLVLGLLLTAIHWTNADKEVREFINSTNPDRPGTGPQDMEAKPGK